MARSPRKVKLNYYFAKALKFSWKSFGVSKFRLIFVAVKQPCMATLATIFDGESRFS